MSVLERAGEAGNRAFAGRNGTGQRWLRGTSNGGFQWSTGVGVCAEHAMCFRAVVPFHMPFGQSLTANQGDGNHAGQQRQHSAAAPRAMNQGAGIEVQVTPHSARWNNSQVRLAAPLAGSKSVEVTKCYVITFRETILPFKGSPNARRAGGKPRQSGFSAAARTVPQAPPDSMTLRCLRWPAPPRPLPDRPAHGKNSSAGWT